VARKFLHCQEPNAISPHRHSFFLCLQLLSTTSLSVSASSFAKIRRLIVVRAPGDGGVSTTYAESKTNGCRELKELRALTGDENGAQRVAFTETWSRARAWLREKLQLMPLEIHSDLAGNVWATLSGKSERSLLIGGHIDSVPNGGWLDGCLNGSGAKFLKCMFLLGE
jgi:hypothetical protein